MSDEVVQPPGFFQPGGTGTQIVKGIIPSIINYFTQRKLQKEQNEFNRQQIHEQNEYNSPSATMNRMIAAGISPKAAQESIAQVPTLGAQSSVATAAPFNGNMPGTDFMNGMSQGYANDLVSSQTQSIQAHDQMDFLKLGQDLKESQQRIQESIANMHLTDARTATEKMEKMFREQEQPYKIKGLEAAYVTNSLLVSAYTSMTPSERQRLIKDARNTWLNQSASGAAKAFFDSKNFNNWSRTQVEKLKRDYNQYHYEAEEYRQRQKIIGSFVNMLYNQYTSQALQYGWSKAYTQFYFDNSFQYFDNLREGLNLDYQATSLQQKTYKFWFDHPDLYDIRTALGLGNNLVGQATQAGRLAFDVGKAVFKF